MFETTLVLLLFAVSVGIAGGAAFLRLQGVAIAACVALIPLPGIIVASIYAAFGTASFSALWAAFAYALGWALSLIMADRYVGLRLQGVPERAAIHKAWWADARALAAIAIMAILVPCMVATSGSGSVRKIAFLVAIANGAAMLSSFLAVWPCLTLIPHGEDFIAETNRIRETWTRTLDRLAPLAEPRWAASAAGVLLVFFVMAAFGAAALHITHAAGASVERSAAGSAAILLICAYVIGRNWRNALAIFALSAGCLLFGAWGFARAGVSADALVVLFAADLLAASFIPIALIASGISREADADEALAYFEAIIERGPAALTAAGGILGILFVWSGAMFGGFAGLALALVFAAASAAVFVPALVHVIEVAMPRRRALADRYRTH